MVIDSMTIDGVEYSVENAEGVYKCYECDVSNLGSRQCLFHKILDDTCKCPLDVNGCRSVLKRKRDKDEDK